MLTLNPTLPMTPAKTDAPRTIEEFVRGLPPSATLADIGGSFGDSHPWTDDDALGQCSPKMHSMRWALLHKSEGGFVVQFPGGGANRTREFRAPEYGSMGAAQEAARQWRDEQAVKLTSVLLFPNHKIFWGDGELDMLAERVAWLEYFHKYGMPSGANNVLHYLRMAVIQVLPYTRWRRIQGNAFIPRTLVMRLSKFRQITQDFDKAYGKAMMAKPKDGAPAPVPASAVVGESVPVPPVVVAPVAAVAPAGAPPGFGGSLGIIETYVLAAIKASTEPFMKDMLKRMAFTESRVEALVQKVEAFVEQAHTTVKSAGERVDACTLSPKDVIELKEMQMMLAEELDSIRRVAGEFEDGKDEVATRLREMESTVFRLSRAKESNGGSHPPMEEGKPCVVPVIVVIGPLPDQFAALAEKVGNAAELLYLDNKHSGSVVTVPERAQWAICNRFVNHSEQNVMKQKVGAGRVMFISSGGISSMVRAVMEIVERVNREDGK